MNAVAVLREAQNCGVHIRVDSGDLLLNARRKPAVEILEALRRHKTEIVSLLTKDRPASSSAEWQEYFEERAAIAQYDGEQTRSQAEGIALECCLNRWMIQNPVRSDPDRCLWCGHAGRDQSILIPFGTHETGPAWLHADCWSPWQLERQECARRALAALGLPVPMGLPDGVQHVG